MKIGTCESATGEISGGMLTLATLSRGEAIQIPIHIAEGKTKGKTIFLSSGVHGDELNGIELNRRFFKNFVEKEHIKNLSGTIIFLPLLNPSGFYEHRREVSFDDKDFNRAFNFGDDRERTITNEMTDRFMEEVISRCDYGMDLHDSGKRNILLPHCRVHIEKTTGCTLEMGSLVGFDLITERVGKAGMMAVEAHEKFGIPIVTVEVGGGSILWEHFIDRAMVGIRNIFMNFGFLPGKIILPEKQFVINLDEREGYHAPSDGLIDIKIHLGEAVEKNQTLACLYNPLTGEEEEIKSKECGIVLSRRMRANIRKGDPIVSVLGFEQGLEKGTCNAKGAKMIFNKETDKIQVIESEVYLKALGLRV